MDLLVVDNDAKFGAMLDAALDGIAVTVLEDCTQLRATCDGLADNQIPVVVCSNESDMNICVESAVNGGFLGNPSAYRFPTVAAYAPWCSRYLAGQRICQ